MDSYNKKMSEVLRDLRTDIHGLSSEEAERRLKKFGLNKLKDDNLISKYKIFINQFKSFLVWILIAATVISFLLGETADSIVILIIVVFNAIFGFLQDYKAEKAIAALKKLAAFKAIVIRDGISKEIDAEHIVPGDILLFSEGSKVAADARIIESIELATQEASLTGESTPITKNVFPLKGTVAVSEQKNMVFSSTDVVRGKGRGVVVKTGAATEIGKIATLIRETTREATPLQMSLDKLGRKIGIITIIICILIFFLEVFTNLNVLSLIINLEQSFLVAVALAVAAVPEGLPAVVTISLALGVRRMVRKNALVRRLASVETLGSTNVICTDKTGTLTKNEMTVKRIYVNGRTFAVTGTGYNPQGNFLLNGKVVSRKELAMILKIGVLCNNAELFKEDGSWKVVGDPTEGALLVSARKAGIKVEGRRVRELPFSSERKMMSVIYDENGKKTAYVKGAADVLLKFCNRIYENGKVVSLTNSKRKCVLESNKQFGSDALRVLGFAYAPVIGKFSEKNLIFVGLQGMIDPPREEAKESIKLCHDAGIRVVMITGDYKETAVAVAKALNIGGQAVTGAELDSMSNETFRKKVADIGIYARVNPQHKLRIVNALKLNDNVVAMTGDGVNDAPALKKADIGISMGVTGTDVAKEASDMILTDDNFSSIVEAVRQGRGIYDNIRKFINYLLSSNLGEILVIFIASLVALPLPVTAIQILWINLLTDGLPAIALGVDPPDKDIMKRKPRSSKEHILNRELYSMIAIMGVLIAVGVLVLFRLHLGSLQKAQTVAFTALVTFEMVRIQMIRSKYHVGIFSNKPLIAAVILSIMLQIIVIYTPLRIFFGTVALSIADWLGIIVMAALITLIGLMALKFIDSRNSISHSHNGKSA